MKKILIVFLILLLSSVFSAAKDMKVAIIGLTNVSQTGRAFRSERGVESYGITQDLLSSYSEEILTTLVVSMTPFSVVERRKVSTLIKEQDFGRSGLVNSQQAVKLGALLGANYIITGSIVNIGKASRNFRGYGISTKKTQFSIKVSMKMLNVSTGVIMMGGLYKAGFSKQDTQYSQSGSTLWVRDLLEVALTKFVAALNKKYEKKGNTTVANPIVKIDVTSTPDGADVEVGGVYMGTTPCKIELDKNKILEVIIKTPGYNAWKRKVKVIKGLKIKARLEKK